MPRLGCVPYLNARPLIAYFETPEGKDAAEVLFAPPSDLAEMLDRGEVDVALASSAFALKWPRAVVAPHVSISSAGPVESVRLFSKKPLDQIETLSLDRSSITSNWLVQIHLLQRYGVRPITSVAQPNPTAMLEETDACVLIGDHGLRAPSDGLHVVDLGAAWQASVGLPFVWALWIGSESLSDELAGVLIRARDYGLRHIEELAQAESARLQWPYASCLRYLVEVMDYDFGSSHAAGLAAFGEAAQSAGLVTGVRLPPTATFSGAI